MKRHFLKAKWMVSAVVSVMMVLGMAGAAIPASAAATYTGAPVGSTWDDTSGNPIQAHGGGFLQVGSTYYWVGEDRSNGGNCTSLNLYKSTDLVNWTYVSAILNATTNPGLTTASPAGLIDPTSKEFDIERPKLLYNSTTKQYVLWVHWEDGTGYSDSHVLVATASAIDGHYTIVLNQRPGAGLVAPNTADGDGSDPAYKGGDGLDGYSSRDFTVYEDPSTGNAYLISTENWEDMHVYQLNADYTNVVIGTDYTLFHTYKREAPAVIKVTDPNTNTPYYYLMTSVQAGWYPNQGAYGYTTNLMDPNAWASFTVNGSASPLQPVGNNVAFASQATWIMPITSTSGTTQYLYLGDRWNASSLGSSTYVWLPLTINATAHTLSMQYTPSWSLNTTTNTIVVPSAQDLTTQVNGANPSGVTITGTSAASTSHPLSSSNDGNYTNLNFTSGDDSNYYQPSSAPYYWEADLGQQCDLSRIDISWREWNGSETYAEYTVQGSNDNSTWTTLADESGNRICGFNSDSLAGYRYRYVRINVTSQVNDHNGNGGNVGIVEATVYGSPVALSSNSVVGLASGQATEFAIAADHANGGLSDLPSTVNVQWQDGSVHTDAVTWNTSGLTFTPYTQVAVTGTAGGYTFNATVDVVMSDTTYFFDSASATGAPNNGGGTGKSPFYTAAKALLGSELQNAQSDQQYNSSSSTPGYSTAVGSSGDMQARSSSSSSIYDYGWYANSGKSILYTAYLQPGTYKVTAGFEEWWTTTNHTRGMNLVATEGSTTLGSQGFTMTFTSGTPAKTEQQCTFTVTTAGNVTFGVNKVSGEDPVMSWIALENSTSTSAPATTTKTVSSVTSPSPVAVYVGSGASALPATVPVTFSDGTTGQANVTWSLASGAFNTAYSTVSVTGTVAGYSGQVSLTADVIPQDLTYFFDCGSDTNSPNNGGGTGNSPFYAAAKALLGSQLQNALSDQQYNSSASTPGYSTVVGSSSDMQVHSSSSASMYDYGWYANSGKSIMYTAYLQPGTYTITAGFEEWWTSSNHTRGMNLVATEGSTTLGSKGFTMTYTSGTPAQVQQQLTFTVTTAGNVTFGVNKASGEDPVMSWIGVESASK